MRDVFHKKNHQYITLWVKWKHLKLIYCINTNNRNNGWDSPVSSAVQGVLGGCVGWRREREGFPALLTKSLVFSGVRERGREMVSGREEKSKRGDVWIFHREEEEKKKKVEKEFWRCFILIINYLMFLELGKNLILINFFI